MGMGIGTRIRPRGRTSRLAAASLASAVGCTVLVACGGSGGTPVINVYGGTSDVGFNTIINQCNAAADGKYKIVGNLLPSAADGQREQMVRRLAAHDSSMDLLGMDVTWTAEFAQAGWIRQLTGKEKEEATDGVLEPTVETALWKDKLYAIPKHTNVQLLWYRKSMLQAIGASVPQTWDDVIADAKKLKAQGKPYVVGFTGAQYEGYVVGFNTILASLGGTIVNADSTKPTVDATTDKALKILHDFATSGVASQSLSSSEEPQVFAQFTWSNESQAAKGGGAAFAINWPYMLSAEKGVDKNVANDMGWTTLPEFQSGTPAKATVGGMDYAISSYSKHPKQAFDAAMCLRDEKHQLANALQAGNPPVLESIYQDPSFQKAYPMYSDMLAELKTAVPRPRTPLYQNISTIISTTLSPPKSINPTSTGNKLKSSIQQALDGKGILP